jgi:TatD DNase family protein
MFDSHAHLNHENFQVDRDEVWSRATEAHLSGLVNVGWDLDSSSRATQIANIDLERFASVGIHPHEAADVTPQVLADLREMTKRPGVVAIGETGLDYFRDLSPRQAQITAFRQHIELAGETGLTLIVHDRDAHDEVLGILTHDAPAHLRVILHCYSAGPDLLRDALGMGCWIGVAGNITYPNAADVREAVKLVPDAKLLLETDCPYLPPQMYRGQRNEPMYMRSTLKAVAQARGEDQQMLEVQTEANALAAFALDVATSTFS